MFKYVVDNVLLLLFIRAFYDFTSVAEYMLYTLKYRKLKMIVALWKFGEDLTMVSFKLLNQN